VVPPERLVTTEVFDDQSYAGQALVTQVLAEHGGATTLVSTVRYPSRQARDTVLACPMARGVGESDERLDRVLADLTSAPEPARSSGGVRGRRPIR
jgi:uncharacterized protein YndB with AHSA1/START domain